MLAHKRTKINPNSYPNYFLIIITVLSEIPRNFSQTRSLFRHNFPMACLPCPVISENPGITKIYQIFTKNPTNNDEILVKLGNNNYTQLDTSGPLAVGLKVRFGGYLQILSGLEKSSSAKFSFPFLFTPRQTCFH